MQKGFLVALLVLLAIKGSAQVWVPTSIANMPMRTSNNAVCEAKTTVGDFMYSFGGIDTSKKYSGIHQKCFKYDITSDVWTALPDLPDTLGKIASAASFVKGKIYIIGGYHVYLNGGEISSSRVHIFNPGTDTFLPDGAPVPVPIDDQVQCVWRDSLIYVVTGWSNTTNVANVQIYNPTQNAWSAGTPVPNNGAFKVFGSQGVIRGDTIYYFGGANTSPNFPATSFLKIGIIDSVNPTNINWLPFQNFPNHPLYRMVALANPDGNLSFLGGSSVSYNYDGIAYATNLGVPPANEQVVYEPSSAGFTSNLSQNYPMDLRGYADVSSTTKYICGGMEAGQEVSSKAYRLSYMNTVNVLNTVNELGIKIYPNPVSDRVFIIFEKADLDLRYNLFSITGNLICKGRLDNSTKEIEANFLNRGVYFLSFEYNGKKGFQKFIKE